MFSQQFLLRVSIGGLVVRAEDLWHWLRLVLWVRAPLLATLCVTYILRSSHITHYFKAVVDPDMTYLVSVGSLSNMHFIYTMTVSLARFCDGPYGFVTRGSVNILWCNSPKGAPAVITLGPTRNLTSKGATLRLVGFTNQSFSSQALSHRLLGGATKRNPSSRQ